MSNNRSESNKANSLLSTGPKDTSRTRFNATKHGLTAAQVGPLDRELYDVMLEEFRRTLLPENPIDEILVERMTLCAVRMRRCAALAEQFMDEQLSERIEEPPARSKLDAVLEYAATDTYEPDQSLAGLREPLVDLVGIVTRTLTEDVTESDRLQLAAAAEAFAAAVEKFPKKRPSTSRDLSSVADKFWRHELTFENRFIKLLNEYERLRRMRAGDHVPAPLSVNLTVHGNE